MKKIVTVDGPAGSGKSTIAKLLANRIGFSYLDTGALYRCVTHYMLENKISPKDNPSVEEALNKIKIDINKDVFTLNGEDITEKLRNENVSKRVASFAQLPNIRDFVKRIQKKIAENEHFIVDGRDIGTVVFKDAFCKFYLDASPTVRAQRRLDDNKEDTTGKEITEIEKDILVRDITDRNRVASPLKIPVDALVIDSSNLSIEEVMKKMVNHYNKRLSEISKRNLEKNSSESKLFLSALENLESKEYLPQSLIKAKIINIKEKEIILDVGSKRDGIISGEEVQKLHLSSLKKGEEIDVYILKADSSSPQIFVSKLEADKRSGLIKIKKAFENNETIDGEVSKIVKGGFVINISDNQAFCPYSEYDIRKVNKNIQTGKKDKFYIIEFDGEKKIIVSRKKHLEEIHQQAKEKFFEKIKEEDIISGKVVHIAHFGAFIEIEEGVTAILRSKNISWGHYENISKIISKGQTITVKVIMAKKEGYKLEVSKKDLEEDPFISFQNFHNINEVVKGKVKNLEPFGAFIEVAPNLEGLMHVSELSWTEKINHPKQVLKVGDEIECKILSIDSKRRKIALGLKQMVDDPWNTIELRYPREELIRAKIKSITKSGLVCEIDGGFEGFINISDISWTSNRVKLKEEFKENTYQQVKVIGYDKKKRRLRLGIKQQSSNPWENLKNNYGLGGVIFAKVTKIVPTGVFAKVSDEIEGFCHISQASNEKVEKIEDAFEVEKSYHFSIQVIDEKNKKVSLSIKQYLLNEERKNIEKYLDQRDSKNTISLGDLINN